MKITSDGVEVRLFTFPELESVSMAFLQVTIRDERLEVADRIAAARVILEHVRATRNQELVKSVVESCTMSINVDIDIEYRYVDSDRSIKVFYKDWNSAHVQPGQTCVCLPDMKDRDIEDIRMSLEEAYSAGYEDALRNLGKLLK